MPFLIAFGLAALLTPVVGWLGPVFGLVDRPAEDGLKIHRAPVSVLGGVAVVASAWTGFAALWGLPSWGLLAATLLALVGGLLDDVRPLPPWVRVLVQLAAGGLLIAGSSLGELGVPVVALLVLLVAACANAVNIVDGQDGLAAGLAALAALGFSLLTAIHGDEVGTALGLALAGSLNGFLLWNRPPARVFLGNGGAYAVGILLAALAARVIALRGWQGLLAAGACLAIFAFELVFTVVRRWRSRGRVTVGDRLHSYDLVFRDWGSVPSLLFFWGLGALAVGCALLVDMLPLAMGIPATAVGGVAAAAWGVRLWSRRAAITRRPT